MPSGGWRVGRGADVPFLARKQPYVHGADVIKGPAVFAPAGTLPGLSYRGSVSRS